MYRNRGATEAFPDAFHGAVEAGAVAIEFVDDDGAGQLVLIRVSPHFFRERLDSGDRVDDYDQSVDRHQGRQRVVREQVKAGSVEKVNLGLFPLDSGDRRGNGELALDLLFVVVGNGISLIDARQAIGRSGGKQQPGHYGSLAAMAVAYNAHVSDVLRFVYLHECLRFKNGILSQFDEWQALSESRVGIACVRARSA